MGFIFDLIIVFLLAMGLLAVLVLVEAAAIFAYHTVPAVRKKVDKFFDGLPDWEK